MKSMTGYGYCDHQDEKSHFMMNLKSYNNRFLDVIVYVPAFLNQLEPRIRTYLSDRIKRGRIEFSMKVQEIEEEVKVRVDTKILTTYVNVFQEIINTADLKEKVSLSNLLRIDGILKTEKCFDVDRYWDKVELLLGDLFAQYDETRIIEGQRTLKSIVEMVDNISNHVDSIETFVPQIEIKIKEVILKKFQEVVGNEIEESRMLAEIAVMMIKYDIREEIVRMRSHLESFREILSHEGNAVGKKLDFLCQELNREINTIGSKSIFLDVNNSVISIKDFVETIREQLRNVE